MLNFDSGKPANIRKFASQREAQIERWEVSGWHRPTVEQAEDGSYIITAYKVPGMIKMVLYDDRTFKPINQ